MMTPMQWIAALRDEQVMVIMLDNKDIGISETLKVPQEYIQLNVLIAHALSCLDETL